MRAVKTGAAGDMEIVAAYESNPVVREQRAADPLFAGIPWLPRAEDLLADDSIQVIVVDGEIWQFLGDARQALLAGKHVYLEKPAGTDLEAYRQVLDLAAARRLAVTMAYSMRHSPPFQLLFRLVRDSALGDIFSIRGRIGKPKSNYSRWMEAMPYPGHIMFEMCGHLIDPMVAVLGRPQRVTPFLRSDYRRPDSGSGPTILPARGIPGEAADRPFIDNAVAVLEWGGALGIVEAAGMEVGADRRLEVLGTGGTLVIEPPGGARARLFLERASHGYEKGWQVVDDGPWTPYAQDLRDLAAVVQEGQPPPFSAVHDYLVQETLLRASGVVV